MLAKLTPARKRKPAAAPDQLGGVVGIYGNAPPAGAARRRLGERGPAFNVDGGHLQTMRVGVEGVATASLAQEPRGPQHQRARSAMVASATWLGGAERNGRLAHH